MSSQSAGRHSEALAIFEEVASRLETVQVSDANIYAAIGHCHLLLANPDESIAYSERALDIDPESVRGAGQRVCRVPGFEQARQGRGIRTESA